jgi:hypothetical protein
MNRARWQTEAVASPGQLLTLDQINREVDRMARRLGGPPGMRPDFGRSRDDGTPHIEVDSAYHYVTCERGRELQRKSTSDPDALLRWIASDMARSIAGHLEAGTRRPHQDSRRQLFRYWRERLASLDEVWAARLDDEISAILEKHPFVDR